MRLLKAEFPYYSQSITPMFTSTSTGVRQFTTLLPPLTQTNQETNGMDETEVSETLQNSSSSPNSDCSDYTYLSDLNKWYRDMHDVSLKDAFVSCGTKLEDNSWIWTSTFVCPMLGDRVPAGSLPGLKPLAYINGHAYYGKKKVAMQAAAMNAYFRLANETKFNEKAVRTELNAWYLKHHGISLRDGAFESRFERPGTKNGNLYWWTTSFTCPVSGDVYEAGAMKNAIEFYRSPDDRSCWYKRKSQAITAAAARVLDAKRFEISGVANPRYCEEDPSIAIKDLGTNLRESERPSEIPLEENRETTEFVESEAVSIGSKLVEKEKTIKIYENEDISIENILNYSDVCKALSEWYEEKHLVSIDTDSFIATTAALRCCDETDIWWTASFICPVHGVRYDTGILKGGEHEIHHKDSENVIWYKKKLDAIVAVAARTLDSARYLESGVREPRYCEEDPASSEQPEMEYLDQSRLQAEVGEGILKEFQPKIPSDSAASTEKKIKDPNSNIINPHPTIPKRHPIYNPTPQTTLGIIAKTWNKTSDRVDAEKPGFPVSNNPVAEMKRAINVALEWSERQRAEQGQEGERRKLFNLDQRSISLQIANLVLDSLARANSRLPFESATTGVEAAATAVVEMMWSSKTVKPNADTYASYLLCLEGDNPLSIARRGQVVLEAMKGGIKYNGRRLPMPNTSVMNSVIQLFARVGGTSARLGRDPSIEPNRDTFLSMLSSMAYPATVSGEESGFDADYARTCIQQMRECLDDTRDDSFLPDTMTYNAPLRWSGGLKLKGGRLYEQPVPWDQYHEIFRAGFNSFSADDPLIIEAEAMESWLEEMEMSRGMFPPDIETYESVIQAWIRTGTFHGLIKAEALALRTFNSGMEGLQPRVQTLHPILSAWIYSGAEAGSAKVEEWADRLGMISGTLVDGRLLTAKLLADVSYQERQLDGTSPGQLLRGVHDNMSERAKSCSRCLRELAQRLKFGKENFHINADSFILALQAYNNVINLNMVMGTHAHSSLDYVLPEILAILDSYDELLVSLSADQELRSDQFLHLMQFRTKVYSAALVGLNEYSQIEPSVRNDHRWQEVVDRAFRNPIGNILPRKKQSSVLECPDSNQNAELEQIFLFDDQFLYPSDVLLPPVLAETTADLFYHLLKYYEGGNVTDKDDESLVQLCVLASDNISHDEIPSARESVLALIDRLHSARNVGDNSRASDLLLNLKVKFQKGATNIKESSQMKRVRPIRSRANGGNRSEKRRDRARWSHKASSLTPRQRNSLA